jgi:phospholipase C
LNRRPAPGSPIRWRWGLAPLSARDAAANNLAEVLDFSLKGRSALDYNVPQIASPPCPIITSRRR